MVVFKSRIKNHIVKKTGADADVLNKLRSFLDAEEPQVVTWLVSVWNSQQRAVTYKELRDAILAGDLTVEQLNAWQLDYSRFVTDKLAPAWAKAMSKGAEDTSTATYNPYADAAVDFIQRRGAELVTNMTAEQRNAIRAMILQASVSGNNLTADSLSRMIRPVIGLTRPQALANYNYYVGQLNAHLDAGMSQTRAEKTARDAAAKYAGRQHRYRAMNIARTELATAYNQGAFGGTKDAQAKGFIGDCIKRWLTADDERVCKQCGGLEGETVNMDATFSIGVLIPPAHPSCRCGVAYEQVTEPVVPVSPDVDQFTDVENGGIMDLQDGDAGMSFEMPKGYEMPISDDEFDLISRNILAEHITQVIPLNDEAQERVNQAYVNIIQKGIDTGTETMHVLNSTSGIDIMKPVIGGKTSVNSNELEKLIVESPPDSLILIHNHPSNASFSTQDMFITATHPSISMSSVVGHDGSIYELRIVNNRDVTLEQLRSRFNELQAELAIDNEYTGYNTDEKEQFIRNEIIDTISFENRWEYRRSFYYERPIDD